MFGIVNANVGELTPAEKERYGAVYCGICREIRNRSSQLCRLGLRYDMAFLALLLMSLYEPEEKGGDRACMLHPVKGRRWVCNEFTAYAADMNVALAYYKALDDWQDEKKPTAKAVMGIFKKHCPRIEEDYPRQCGAIAACLERLSALEKENCPNPDLPAGAFGALMGELLVYREDLWAPYLRELGMALGRFIYLADAVMDYTADASAGRYNPLAAMGMGEDRQRWEEYLVLAMGRCTEYFERLPLVQDKSVLDNILYSGVWTQLRKKQRPPKGDV